MCRDLFQIRCTSSWFFMTAVNIFLNVSVYGIYIFYLRCVHSQNLSHLINGFLLCCKCAFEGWIAEKFTAFVYTNITTPCLFFIFRCDWSLSSPLISYALGVCLSLSTHVVVLLLIYNSSDCIFLLMCTIVLLIRPICFDALFYKVGSNAHITFH